MDSEGDLQQALERGRRRFGPPVRLEVSDTMSEHVVELLVRELDVDPPEVMVWLFRRNLDLSEPRQYDRCAVIAPAGGFRRGFCWCGRAR